MPIIARDDARDLDERLAAFFRAPPDWRAQQLRQVFVEKMDFSPATGRVSLAKTPKGVDLPRDGERIAARDGVNVVYVPLSPPDTDRVRKAEAVAAAKLAASELGDDLLLLMTNTSGSQLHVILPSFKGTTPSLRRMVIERDLPSRTAVQQLSNIYWEWEKVRDIRTALEHAFNVEVVTRKFFEEYKRLFNEVMDKVTGFSPSEAEQEDKKLFVQTLFNRLMFVYFLSRKGWLRFRGDRDYLNALWKDYKANKVGKTFYGERLKVLFFAALNNPQARDLGRDNPALHALIGDVPFLNGGLFDEDAADKRRGIVVPDGAIDLVLHQLFDRFNFTVMESTPFDVEVAVDPEMLGKVFEELVTGRHETGSYYTPRPIVAFMAREALKGYLQGAVPGLSSEAINEFVDLGDVSGLTYQSADRVRSALEAITILDPACGSGAYLVGMLQELVELETALYSERLVRDPKSLYDLKLRIIERSLYGADIDRFAVNVAMLRLWLSLAIEYEGEVPEPLPNLDFKILILCGDSLTGPDPDPRQLGNLFQHAAKGLAKELADLKHQFLLPTEKRRAQFATTPKSEMKRLIEAKERQLAAALAEAAPKGAIDWRVQCYEVIERSGGFDIVIANPPYRRMEELKDKRETLRATYPGVFASRADYHVYFYNRSVQLLRSGGALSFITSNKYMRAVYGEKIRAFLPKELTLGHVIDFGDLPVFEAASYPAVVIGRKTPPPANHSLQVVDLVVPVRHLLAEQGMPVNGDTVKRAMEALPQLLDQAGVPNYPQVLLRKSGWILEDPKLVRLFDRLMAQGTPLAQFVQGRMYRGIPTGLDNAFVIDESTRRNLIAEDASSVEVLRKWIRGRDIKRWRIDWGRLYLIFANRGFDIRRYPAIRRHLERCRQQLERRATAHLHPWYELQQPQQGIYPEFSRPKIVWPTNGNPVTMQFAWDDEGVYCNSKAYFLPDAPLWLLGVLNSTLMHWMVAQLCTKLRGGWFEMKANSVVGVLPIAVLDGRWEKDLERVVRRMVRATADEDPDELDQIVAKAYGLGEQDRTMLGAWRETRAIQAVPGSDDEQEEENEE